MLDEKWIDQEFAAIKDVIFLNVPYIVVPPQSVQDAYFGLTRDCIANFSDDATDKAWKMVGEARADVAGLFGAQASEIAFVKNTAEGVGIVANGFPFRPGENVVVIDQDHSSSLYAWIHLQRKGVGLRVVKSKDGRFSTDDVIAACDKKTRAIALSAVQFTTGFYADLAAIGEFCRQRDILFVVDAIQAAGRMHIDVNRMGIDYLACGGNKGLLAVLGAGIVYCSQRIVGQIVPTYAGYQSVVNHAKPPAITEDFSQLVWHDDARRFEAGNLNYAGVAAIRAGVRVLRRIGTQDIEKHVRALEDELRSGIESLPLKIQRIPDAKNRSGIICVYYPARKEAEVVGILKEHKVHATMRGGYIRMGLHLYNKPWQVGEVVHAFKRIAALG
jgi:cysteine desulfurase/selenocysteine lyase